MEGGEGGNGGNGASGGDGGTGGGAGLIVNQGQVIFSGNYVAFDNDVTAGIGGLAGHWRRHRVVVAAAAPPAKTTLKAS